MSRDLTPKDALFIEQYTGVSMFEFMSSTVVHYNGKEEPLYTPEAIALRKQFPLFGKLVNRFELLHASLSEIEGGMEFLREKEKELEEYIEEGKGDPESYIVKWFEGKLDPNFYYSEMNEEMFRERLIEEAKEQKK